MNDFDGAMREVLKQGKYNILAGRFIDWREKLFAFLADVLDWIFERLHLPKLESSTGGADLLVIIFLVAAAALVLLIAGSVIFFVIRRKRRKTLGDVFQGIDEGLTPAELLQAGMDLAAQENFREAVRYCFAAILLALDSRKVIRIEQSKTNRQISREIQNIAPMFSDSFDGLADGFNMVWFGQKNFDAERFQNFWQQTSDLVRRVGNHEIRR